MKNIYKILKKTLAYIEFSAIIINVIALS